MVDQFLTNNFSKLLSFKHYGVKFTKEEEEEFAIITIGEQNKFSFFFRF